MKKKKALLFSLFVLLICLFSIFPILFMNKEQKNSNISDTPSIKDEVKKEEEKKPIEKIDEEKIVEETKEEKNPSKPNEKEQATDKPKENPIIKPNIQETPVIEEKPIVETQEQKNDTRRKEIEATYGITILYGNEIGNYKPRMLKPTFMTDSKQIAEYLEKINNTLKYYPKGFFKDFVKIDMPLTIILIDSVENNSFAGLTDKEFYDDIKITMTTKGIFNYVLNHEIMHYIDAYLTIKIGEEAVYNEWKTLNPAGYRYGSFIEEYNYNMLNHKYGAYFIENYAQTNIAEDRAKTFEYMMSRAYAPAGCFDEGEIIRKKAELIAKQIEKYFPSTSNTVTEHWERFIK